ncbi:hypothetical protein NKR23_g8591 [Pleurostoma richardsiae]|uniref:Uncharacterized protein n=1 Tax=Pleurostoma richardsiae TaxID=41990 RepID=A0AA38RF01_9PEZI|nr:hypothetical protein NKR23_g8591 [Pleurostoma richardsiae]
MWDRFRTAGGPHLKLDRASPLDEKSASSFSAGVPFGYTYQIKGGQPPPRPPREFPEEQFDHAAAPPAAAQPPPRPPGLELPPQRNSHRNTYRSSGFRPTSSIYSQPSPQAPTYGANVHATRYLTGGRDDVSPPSSPEALTPRDEHYRPVSPDISPIDEYEPDRRAMSQLNSSTSRPAGQRQASGDSARTNIPMMRRERRKMSDAALREKNSRDRLRLQAQAQAQEGEGAEVRWDAMTGELTTSEKGRPSQVKPAEYARGLGISGTPTSPPAQKSPTTSFGDRVRRMTKTSKEPVARDTDPAAGAFTSSRPGWRGASGRTTLVDPVYDKPDVAPLRIPRKSSRRAASPPSRPRPSDGVGGLDARLANTPVSPPAAETGRAGGTSTNANTNMNSSTIRKVVPSSSSQQDQAQPSPRSVNLLPSQVAPAGLNNISGNAPIRRKPPPAHAGHKKQGSASSTYSQPDLAAHPALRADGSNNYSNDQSRLHGAGESPWVQPPSRFSVTTYAPSEKSTATPRESNDGFVDRPPMPTPPQQYRDSPGAGGNRPSPNPDSVMDRQRPKLRSGGDDWADREPIKISLGQPWMSTPFSTSASTSRRDTSGDSLPPSPPPHATDPSSRLAHPSRRESTLSVNKTLPAAPPEISASTARDRVALLNAQLQSLANRRTNLTRSIRQMTELMPTDNLLDSAEVVARRDAERRKVEELRVELAECRREEYELGLRLHRAYKRMDRDAEFEPTTLWVRRVTG